MSHQHFKLCINPVKIPCLSWWYNKVIKVPTITVSSFLVYYGTGQQKCIFDKQYSS